MHDTGCLGLVHWDDPEGWYGEGGERGVQDGEHVSKTSGPFAYNQHTGRSTVDQDCLLSLLPTWGTLGSWDDSPLPPTCLGLTSGVQRVGWALPLSPSGEVSGIELRAQSGG